LLAYLRSQQDERSAESAEGEPTMSPYDAKFDVARDNLAIYSGALYNVIDLLESKKNARQDEIAAYRQELERVNNELNTMRPDDQELMNKANHIYSRLSRNLMNEYLLKTEHSS
jgi:predicted RNase H-like nuclease (RuvC/YqgF family)